MQSIESFIKRLAANLGDKEVNIAGLRDSAAAFVAARIIKHIPPAAGVFITANEPAAQAMAADLNLFCDLPVYHYPAYEIPPYTPLSPDPHTTAERLSTLYSMVTAESPYLAVVSCEALLRMVMPKSALTDLAELVIRDEETDQQELIRHLQKAGYEQLNLVQNAGEYSVRGGIIDIFPPGFQYPVRIDFFGDIVESIRHFDPISQRSVEELDEVILIPVHDVLFPEKDSAEHESMLAQFRRLAEESEWTRDQREVIEENILESIRFPGIEFYLPIFYRQLSHFFDYLPEQTQVFLFDPPAIRQSAELTWERIEANYQEAKSTDSPLIEASKIFLSTANLKQLIEVRKVIAFHEFIDPSADGHESWHLLKTQNHKLLKQQIELKRKQQGMLPALSQTITAWLEQKHLVAMASRSERHAEQLKIMLGNYGIEAAICHQSATVLPADSELVSILPSPLSAGFDLLDFNTHFLSENELFGDRAFSKKSKKTKYHGEEIRNFDELHPDDIVVHKDHGLALYKGIVNLQVNNIANDFIELAYKDGDKLYVPVDRMNIITKYIGFSERQPKLSKLGSQAWTTTKKKAKDAVWKVAQSLLHLYAKRKLEHGIQYSRPDELYQELEESFPYDETSGQLKAIDEVISDLTSDQPMDRLVCGDVGFGKTEVAVRAAFKVVADNYQVAILVPTTVLAEQHYQTFQERFENFPVTVGCLNRFRTTAAQKKLIREISEKKVDIVIGTHRLLSKDVHFHNLGLLIIDEEHRFGVTHKEKLKHLRSKVDVLTLTATPIPRTLQMSLLGVRDLSVIATPPQHRRSIKTFIAKYDELVIKEAVMRELQRGGQVFLVHNRVRSIHEMANAVQRLVPQARIAVAHGQLPGKNLEEIMVQFVQNEIDVLICTTIIESGLDIPNANTIIITRADRMGLAEIYQLRGRVGRASEQAYAYLLVPSLEHLSKDAKQRLRALMEYNELGGGFKLAMSDLQIRGGGNILGESQSGAIAAVGYDLYLELLQKTVDDLKHGALNVDGEPVREEIDPEINLAISAYIPAHYIADTSQRYIAYRKIASAQDENALLDLQDEFRDRYGQFSTETENLFEIMRLKQDLKKMRVLKLEQGSSALVFTFLNDTEVSPERILHFIKEKKNQARMTPDGKLIVNERLDTPGMIFKATKNILRALL